MLAILVIIRQITFDAINRVILNKILFSCSICSISMKLSEKERRIKDIVLAG